MRPTGPAPADDDGPAAAAPLLARARELDGTEPLRHLPGRYLLPEGLLYLDGNSLGALPRTVADRLQKVVREEWGTGLISSWNTADWIGLTRRVGARIAPLVGAGAGDVHVGDSTTVTLFKTLVADLDGALTVCIVPVAHELDLRSLGKRARMADTAKAERTTGYVAGGISPLGQRSRLATVVDESVTGLPAVYVSAGRRGLQVRLSPADLLRVSGARTARLRRD